MERREGKTRRSKGEILGPLSLSDLFLWGIVTRPHGLRGHVLIRVFAQNPRAYPLKTFWVTAPGAFLAEPKRVASIQPYHQRSPDDPRAEPIWRGRFTDIKDRNAAETLRGLHLYLPRAYLPPLPPGHFYYFEAENAQVADTREGPKGILQEIVPGPAYDFFVVQGVEGDIYWIPAPFVKHLDKTTQPPTLWVEAPSDLWDPNLAKGRP